MKSLADLHQRNNEHARKTGGGNMAGAERSSATAQSVDTGGLSGRGRRGRRGLRGGDLGGEGAGAGRVAAAA